MTRKNPPLSQHMEQDDLSEIADLVGPRLHADPSEGAEFVRDCLRFVASGVGDRPAMGEYERQREIKQHLQMASKALGDALAIMHPRRNPSASHGSVPELAHEFSRVLREWLTDDEMEQVIERNAEVDDPRVCASHDFCDANMAMYEAFERVMGHPIDTRKKADVAMWDKAWNMAKASDFAVGRKKRANPGERTDRSGMLEAQWARLSAMSPAKRRAAVVGMSRDESLALAEWDATGEYPDPHSKMTLTQAHKQLLKQLNESEV